MKAMLQDQLAKVEHFHQDITGLPIPNFPQMPTSERLNKRFEFLAEEITEYHDAVTLADRADALVDVIYVAMGGLLEMGIRPGPAFNLVHNRNMAKVPGANKRGSEFEAAKPAGWTPPDWRTFLNEEKQKGTVSDPIADGDLPCGAAMGAFLKDKPQGSYIGVKPRKKIAIIGHGRHGKDTVAEILRDKYGYKFTSSSFACAEKVMMPAFEAAGTPYASVGACFNDRHNHRALWFQKIEEFNTPDKASLARMIFADNDIYVGMRSWKEFHAARNSGLIDVVVWVDRSDHLPPEGSDSMTLQPWMADHMLDNNGDLDQLAFNVRQLMDTLEK